MPNPLRGVTIDDIANPSGLMNSLSQLAHPIARVVFDKAEPASYYSSIIKQIDGTGYTMGCLLDSSDDATTSVSDYQSRAAAYLATLGGSVDLWEIANEANGEWLGSGMPQKIESAYQTFHNAGKKTALTLYYEPPQTVTPGYDMIPWEQANVAADVHAGVDYVLVSYYEVDNNNVRPTQAQWDAIFKQLAIDFPNAKIGFGEVGLSTPATSATQAQAQDIMTYYYGLQFPDIPRYARGGFWWYFAEDMVPSTNPLFSTLQQVL